MIPSRQPHTRYNHDDFYYYHVYISTAASGSSRSRACFLHWCLCSCFVAYMPFCLACFYHPSIYLRCFGLFEICLLSALLYPSYPTYERANEGIAMHMRMRGRRYPKGGFKPLILYVLTSSFVSTVFILGLIMVLCLIVFIWETYLYLFVLALALFVECLLNFCCGSYFLHVWLRFFFLC